MVQATCNTVILSRPKPLLVSVTPGDPNSAVYKGQLADLTAYETAIANVIDVFCSPYLQEGEAYLNSPSPLLYKTLQPGRASPLYDRAAIAK